MRGAVQVLPASGGATVPAGTLGTNALLAALLLAAGASLLWTLRKGAPAQSASD